jgi:hypothetical protein
MPITLVPCSALRFLPKERTDERRTRAKSRENSKFTERAWALPEGQEINLYACNRLSILSAKSPFSSHTRRNWTISRIETRRVIFAFAEESSRWEDDAREKETARMRMRQKWRNGNFIREYSRVWCICCIEMKKSPDHTFSAWPSRCDAATERIIILRGRQGRKKKKGKRMTAGETLRTAQVRC